MVDGRDVVTGLYETITVAPPLQSTTSLTVIEQSPLVINGTRDAGSITITLQNAESSAVTTQPFVVLVGAERTGDHYRPRVGGGSRRLWHTRLGDPRHG